MLRNIPNRATQPVLPTEAFRVVLADLVPTVNPNSRFTFTSVGWVQTDITDAGIVVFQVPSPPIGSRLLSATFMIDPGVHVALPATKPQFQVVRSLNSGSLQLGATVVDPAATIAAYNPPHAVVVPDLNFTLAPDAFDFIEVTIAGETGAGAVTGLRLVYVEFLIGLPN